MSRPTSDRDLLFGLVALQNGFIDQEMLIAAFRAWSTQKLRSLPEILEERSALSSTVRAALEALVAEHVRQHGGDPQRSLAALSSPDGTNAALQDLRDGDLAASLANVGVASRKGGNPLAAAISTCVDSWATLAGSLGESTNGGSRFRIVRPHARGGLGEVFVAVDVELNREVALKQIQNQHADLPQSRSRFVLEAEITGGLEHPGIVPVYSLGHDASGRPFYAMRFIRGDSLKDAIAAFHGERGRAGDGNRSRTRSAKTQGADASPVAFRQLLRRFLDVCNALAYAHSRGVLHRDIKPGNIMVGRFGETLVVDWGLAKVIGTPETSGEATLRPPSASGSSETLPGAAIGTPAFMSPEQAAGQLDRLGPASDVYSLGATLYQLLTGQPPFDGSDVGPILDRVQRSDFPPPCQVEPEVPRALEAICLRAMALRPEDRYPDCRALADDIERWLADEPVTAYLEPWPARLARWGRRHRSLVATAAAILATATIGLAAGLFAVNAEKNRTERARLAEVFQRTRAEAGERQAQAKEAEARDKEAEARAVLDFLKDKILAAARPEGLENALGREVTLRQALKTALPKVEASFRGMPLVEADVRFTLGNSFHYLGDDETAEREFRIARELYAARRGRDHPGTLTITNNLANSVQALGRHAEALELRKETLALRKAKLAPDHPHTLISMNSLASSFVALGRYAEAQELYEETLALRKSKLGADHPDTLETMNNLAASYMVLGRQADALQLREETLALMQAKLGPNHPNTLLSMHNLAQSYEALGRQSEALRLREETLKLRKLALGLDHPDTLVSMGELAASLVAFDRCSEAVVLVDDCWKLARGKRISPGFLRPALVARLRAFATQRDAAGCRQTAEMWEKLELKDPGSLYNAACFRAVTAGVHPAGGQAPDADLAMKWLTRAVASGYSTAQHLAHMMRDRDLDILRDRADFRRLLAKLFDRIFPGDPFAK